MKRQKSITMDLRGPGLSPDILEALVVSLIIVVSTLGVFGF